MKPLIEALYFTASVRWPRWNRDEQGATAVEYAVVLTLILMACFATVILLGTNLNTSWTNTANSIVSATGS